MAVKYSVGLSSTPRDRSLLQRRRASSTRVASANRGEGREQATLELPARKRGWLLLSADAHDDEPDEPSASWAW